MLFVFAERDSLAIGNGAGAAVIFGDVSGEVVVGELEGGVLDGDDVEDISAMGAVRGGDGVRDFGVNAGELDDSFVVDSGNGGVFGLSTSGFLAKLFGVKLGAVSTSSSASLSSSEMVVISWCIAVFSVLAETIFSVSAIGAGFASDSDFVSVSDCVLFVMFFSEFASFGACGASSAFSSSLKRSEMSLLMISLNTGGIGGGGIFGFLN